MSDLADLALPAEAATPEPIAEVAAELRAGLAPLLAALAGSPPRGVRLTRGIALDKSLASRLVKAARAESDLQFLHNVPSPTGLRILLDKSREHAGPALDPAVVLAAAQAIDRFESQLDTLPGGRLALDARLGEESSAIREKREQVARQASFKSLSLLFGYYCETLTTTMFVVPSATAGFVDMIEVHRRIGLQRLKAGASIPLLSVQPDVPEDMPPDAPRLTALSGDPAARAPRDFLLPWASSVPLPELRIVDEDRMTTFVLGATPTSATPTRLSSAIRVQRVARVHPAEAYEVLRLYTLHTACRTLARDVFLAEGLWPDARLDVGFYLPGPSGGPFVTHEPGNPDDHRRLNLSCRIEQLPFGIEAFELDGVVDQQATLLRVLEQTGLSSTAFRGWRCSMAYPVPMVEMQVAFRFGGAA